MKKVGFLHKMSTNEKIERLLKERNYRNNAIIALSVLSVIIAAVALLLAGLQYNQVYYWTDPQSISHSQAMPNSPYAFYVGGSSIALNLAIPTSLTGYIGKVYRVWSIDAGHAHTVTSGSATFDGGSHTATFGGAIGDGFVFEVISDTRIAIISVYNVVFS